MCEEIPLSGGRVTQGVVRKGETVLRPCCANSPFTHEVLLWLEQKGLAAAPRFLGLSEDGREITSFLEGTSPGDLGDFQEEALCSAGILIRALHDALSDFPGCRDGQTVCHNDLSPCNFMFRDGLPYAVFDWDAAIIGNPLDDLAYALWMWCDIGNHEKTPDAIGAQIKVLLDAYGLPAGDRGSLSARIHGQMQRVAASCDSAERMECRQWAMHCDRWLAEHQNQIDLG